MKILPPFWLLICIVLMMLIHLTAPVVNFASITFALLGVVCTASGIALVLSSANLFRKAKTPLKPFEESTALVLEGAFRYTRNPIYLGFVIVLLGTALSLGSVGPLVVPPLFWCIMHYEYVLKEEDFLEERFGKSYLEFKNRTRRWL